MVAGTQTAPQRGLLLLIQDPAQSAPEDVRLCVLPDSARIQHFPVAIDFTIELLDLAAEDVRSENYLLECAAACLRGVRADDARPPEDRLEYLVVLLQL